MTIHRPIRLAAVALLAVGISTSALAGQSNNASSGNDRTMTTQYSRTLLPIGGTMGERNRWDVSQWTGVTTKTASKTDVRGERARGERPYGFHDRDYYSRGMYYRDGTPYRGNTRGW